MRTLLFFLSPFLILACSNKVHIHPEDSEMIQFSDSIIHAEYARLGGNQPTIERFIDPDKLPNQAYTIKVHSNTLIITGGNVQGLMYGGFEVAEQIKYYGKVQNTKHTPYIKNRGLKINIPLDARTPSYDDSGDAAIKNVATMWSWDFWKKQLDQMALNRYNVLSLWNPHPFPSMIKLDDYPDVALNDVCTTTYQPTGYENEMGDPQLVASNVIANLDTIIQLTIDEKIAFWQKVMQYASNRGIDIYWVTWNICPNSVATPVDPGYWTYGINTNEERPGKYGITHQMDNPATIAYQRAAVKQFLLTYPHIKGIGVTAGEHMPREANDTKHEEWLWDTYALGILDAKQEQPDRTVHFIHRVWHTDMDQILKVWDNYPDPFHVSFKYAKARLYSSPNMNFHTEHVKQMTSYGLKSWWNLRNDDIFVYRWGNVEYVRQFLKNLPQENTEGYYMGSDGYVWGRDFVSIVDGIAGELEIEKHWLKFALWGRLGFNINIPTKRFLKIFEWHHPHPNAALLFNAWQTASEIIPQVNRFHWRDWDADWSVEACRARPKLGGFRDVMDFIDNPSMEGENILNPKDYVNSVIRGDSITRHTPIDIAENLLKLANTSLSECDKLMQKRMNPSTAALIYDIQAMAYLGKYYGYKILSATDIAFFQTHNKVAHKENAIRYIEEAFRNLKKYAEISKQNYKPQMLARPGLFDWDEMVKDAEQEVKLVYKI